MPSVAVTNKISYKEALLKVKLNEQIQPSEENKQISVNNEEHTAELTSFASQGISGQDHLTTSDHDHQNSKTAQSSQENHLPHVKSSQPRSR